MAPVGAFHQARAGRRPRAPRPPSAAVGTAFALLGVLEAPSYPRVTLAGAFIVAAELTRVTTGVAAIKSVRKFIGCETVPQYYEIALTRCLQACLAT